MQEPNEKVPIEKKWYFRTFVFAIAFIVVGLLALPLLWYNPYFKRSTKIIASIVLIAVSVFLMWWLSYSWGFFGQSQ